METPVPTQSIEEKPVSPPEAAPVKTEKEKVGSLAARPEPPTSLAVVEEAKQEDRKLLVFTLAGESYAVDVYAIRTTIKPQTVYLLPGTVPHLKGLINLRGEVVPVFDLRTRFAMPEKPIDDQTRFIVVEIGEYQASLIVDSVVGVETIPANLFEKPSGIVMTLDNRFLKSIVRYKDRLILNLNLAMVVSGEEKAGENEAED